MEMAAERKSGSVSAIPIFKELLPLARLAKDIGAESDLGSSAAGVEQTPAR